MPGAGKGASAEAAATRLTQVGSCWGGRGDLYAVISPEKVLEPEQGKEGIHVGQCPVTSKSVKVIKVKERLQNCSVLNETKEPGMLAHL